METSSIRSLFSFSDEIYLPCISILKAFREDCFDIWMIILPVCCYCDLFLIESDGQCQLLLFLCFICFVWTFHQFSSFILVAGFSDFFTVYIVVWNFYQKMRTSFTVSLNLNVALMSLELKITSVSMLLGTKSVSHSGTKLL